MIRALVVAVALVLASSADAQEKRAMSTEFRAGYAVMGWGRATGGLTLGAGGRYLAPIDGGPWGVYAGAGASAVGVDDSWHYMGILVGPEAGGWRTFGPWHVSAGLGLPMGQVTTCTDWGYCPRSWGAFPEAVARVAYRAEDFRIGLEAGGRWFETAPWTGAGAQLALVGAYR